MNKASYIHQLPALTRSNVRILSTPLRSSRPYISRTSHSRFRIISRFSFGKILRPFYPVFSFSLLEKTLSSAHEGTNASRLSYRKKNFRLPCARAEYKRQEDPLSDRLAPLSEKTEIIQNFLAVKPNRREGRLIHGGQGNGTAVFFGEISSGSSINAKSRRPPLPGKATDIKFARFPTRARVHVERRVQHSKTSGRKRRGLPIPDTYLLGNRSILAS